MLNGIKMNYIGVHPAELLRASRGVEAYENFAGQVPQATNADRRNLHTQFE